MKRLIGEVRPPLYLEGSLMYKGKKGKHHFRTVIFVPPPLYIQHNWVLRQNKRIKGNFCLIM